MPTDSRDAESAQRAPVDPAKEGLPLTEAEQAIARPGDGISGGQGHEEIGQFPDTADFGPDDIGKRRG